MKENSTIKELLYTSPFCLRAHSEYIASKVKIKEKEKRKRGTWLKETWETSTWHKYGPCLDHDSNKQAWKKWDNWNLNADYIWGQ